MFLIGINTKVKQTVAKTLGVPLDLVIVKPANVLTSPNNCVTGGSTTSELTCNVSHTLSPNFFRGGIGPK